MTDGAAARDLCVNQSGVARTGAPRLSDRVKQMSHITAEMTR